MIPQIDPRIVFTRLTPIRATSRSPWHAALNRALVLDRWATAHPPAPITLRKFSWQKEVSQ